MSEVGNVTPTDLSGKVAIVTGAARGTGEAIARRFVAGGATVEIFDLLVDEAEAVGADIGATAHEVDVTDEAAWERGVRSVLDAHGRVDVLVNNAAVLHMGSLANTSAEQFRFVLEVNTVGPFLGIRTVAPHLRDNGGGAIVNVASIEALGGMNGLSAYCASKWGVRGLARSLALELGRDGIRVNTVCPAGGNPAMFGPWFGQMSEFLDETLTHLEDRGIPGEAPVEVIADAVAWLASDGSSRCTGVDLPVDGGFSAGDFIPGFNTL